jgi:hypothetical protein
MSIVSVTVKLIKAGYDEEAIADMTREQLIAAWTELIATGKDKPQVKPSFYTDPEIERQRLQFEIQKYREEEERLHREQAAAEAERRREAMEKEERERVRQEEREERLRREQIIAEIELRREQIAAEAEKRLDAAGAEAERLQQEQFEWMKAKDERDQMKQESIAARLKLFGDIIKNVAPKFRTDLADIPMFFESLERVFESVEAPAGLRANLLIPHLGERAKSLMLRLDQARQDSYDEMKRFLLDEFQLTPFQFKNRFDQAKHAGDETCTLFCTRLGNLFEYYCCSRNVRNNFERLFSLLVADRIKACLPQSCLNFTLTAEAAEPKIAYMCDKIVNMFDAYFSTHSFDDKPKVAGYDANRFTPKASVSNNNNKSNAGELIEMTHASKSEGAGLAAVKSLQSTSTSDSSRVRRFACYQFGHTGKQCLNRVSQPQTETSRKVVTSARVQACAISDVKCAVRVKANANKTARGAGQGRAGASVESTAASCSRSEAVDSVDDGDLVAMFDDAGEPRVRHA